VGGKASKLLTMNYVPCRNWNQCHPAPSKWLLGPLHIHELVLAAWPLDLNRRSHRQPSSQSLTCVSDSDTRWAADGYSQLLQKLVEASPSKQNRNLRLFNPVLTFRNCQCYLTLYPNLSIAFPSDSFSLNSVFLSRFDCHITCSDKVKVKLSLCLTN
jgi:hypothetical protein